MEFWQTWEAWKHDPVCLDGVEGMRWQRQGLNMVMQDTHDVVSQERVLMAMMTVWPDHPSFMYYLGYIHLEKDHHKALFWFRQCLHHFPDNVENKLDLAKLLFNDRGHHALINHLLVPHLEHDMRDPRVALLMATLAIENRDLVSAQRQFDDLFVAIESTRVSPKHEAFSSNDVTTHRDDRALLQSICMNASFLCLKNGDLATSMTLLERIVSDPRDADLAPGTKYHTAMQNLLLTYDYGYHDLETRAAWSRKLNNIYQDAAGKEQVARVQLDAPDAPRRRIGYLYNQESRHSVSHFLFPILEHHDTSVWDVYVFTGQTTFPHGDTWTTVVLPAEFTDLQCAVAIAERGMDVLIDLDGLTGGNRVGVLYYRPALIQMTYLGFPNSTGLDFVTYRITDYVADPPRSRQVYSETRVYMPRCFVLYRSLQVVPPAPYRPTNPQCLVLGAWNKEAKNSVEVLRAWKQILAQVPTAVLRIKCDGADIEDYLDRRREYYIDMLECDRVEVVGYLTDAAYVEELGMCDIILDTFPYSGTTTTCNALYNGCPVVTLAHPDLHAHNVSASILTHASLGGLVTSSVETYVAKVVELCRIPEKLNAYKRRVPRAFADTMEPRAFMKDYEALLSKVFLNA